jgi:aspartate 1-decarboxylase
MRWLLRSKINRATITDANIDYIDSIMIDSVLLEKTGLWPGEKVLVVSFDTWARLETYIIPRKPFSGVICMNGAEARTIGKGKRLL